MKWAPNPYAIAQLLADRPEIAPVFHTDGKRADEFLREAFQVKEKRRTLADAVGLFQQLVEAVDRPMSTAEVMDLAPLRRAATGFAADQVQRVLPYLVPLTDAKFAASGSSAPAPGESARTWFEDSGRLTIDGTSYLDPIQGAVGDCYLISAMIALAWASPVFWTTRLGSSGFDPPVQRVFDWQFFDKRGAESRRVGVSGRIPIAAKKTPRYARSASGESWPSLIEKAYVVNARAAEADNSEPTPADYQSIDRGATPPRACQALMGGRVRAELLDTPPGAEIFSRDGKLGTPSGVMSRSVMAWTKEDIGVTDKQVWEKTGLWPNHAYAVLGTMRSEHVVLRNPHGVATEARDGYAEGQWETGERQPVELNKNGVLALSRELFYRHFNNIGWVDRE